MAIDSRKRSCDSMRAMGKSADEVLAVRVPPALKKELKKLAAADRRTVSNLVELLLVQALAARNSQGQAA